MTHEKLLGHDFFSGIEQGDERVAKEHYYGMRSAIVAFSRSSLHWREIHTGLTIIIAELSVMAQESTLSKVAIYAKRILAIAEGMLRQLEMALSKNHDIQKEEPQEANMSDAKVTFTGKYADFCEAVLLILSAKFGNGGHSSVRNHIIIGMHRVFGLEYDSKKFQNARDGIKRRCPANGSRVTYFLDSAVDVVNAELAA